MTIVLESYTSPYERLMAETADAGHFMVLTVFFFFFLRHFLFFLILLYSVLAVIEQQLGLNNRIGKFEQTTTALLRHQYFTNV